MPYCHPKKGEKKSLAGISILILTICIQFLTIFLGSEYGIGGAAGWAVVWTLLRSAFVKPRVSSSSGLGGRAEASRPLTRVAGTENAGITIPEDTVVVTFQDSVFYPNAQRVKTEVLESIQLVYPSVQNPNYRADTARSWSVAGERRLERLRKERNITMKEMPLSVVVWDFTMVPFIDVTGVTALAELKDDIRRQLGSYVEIRMVNLTPGVVQRFERARWQLSEVDGPQDESADIIYPSLERAVWDERELVKDGLKGVVTEKA